jgi:hypothetical protein
LAFVCALVEISGFLSEQRPGGGFEGFQDGRQAHRDRACEADCAECSAINWDAGPLTGSAHAQPLIDGQDQHSEH